MLAQRYQKNMLKCNKNKMAKKCHTVGTILKSNQQFVESEGKSIVLTHIK